MVNRPTGQVPRYPESTNDQQNPPISRPKRVSKIFGRQFSFSSDSSRSSVSLASIQTVLQPSSSTGLKETPTSSESPKPPISPTRVVSILNGMYAKPLSRARVSSHHASHSSFHLNGHTGESVSIPAPARSSTDSNTQKGQATSGHRKQSSSQVSSQEMRGGSSISSSSTSLSKSRTNASTGSEDSGSSSTASSVRVVGRGGSGSKLRYVVPQLASLDPATVRQEQPPPLIRPSGRGGLASRPKTLETPPPTLNVKRPSTSALVRPSGRGGLASRPKPVGSQTSPPLLTLLRTKTKRGIDKGKRRAHEPIRATHPLPPSLTYQISNGSTITLSTIHFVDETGEPSTPFFPDDTCESTKAVASPLSGSSMFTSDRNSSRSSILSDHTAETTEEYCNDDSPTNAADHHQRNLLKLARTLGYYPDDTELPARSPATETDTPAPPLQRKERNAKRFRRASLSVTSLTSMFVKSATSVRGGRDSVTTSMMTDDLHHFGLEDDFSFSWGSSSSSSFCERAASPIVFSPPSPVHERNPNRGLVGKGTTTDVDPQNAPTQISNTESADALSVSSSSLAGSEYNVFAPSRRPSTRASSNSHHQYSTGSALPDIAAENKCVWLVPIKDDDDFDVLPQRYRSPTPAPLGIQHVSNQSLHWSGEWNEDIHKVIKSLRLL